MLGYDLTSAVMNDSDAAPMKGKTMPSIVLVEENISVVSQEKKRVSESN